MSDCVWKETEHHDFNTSCGTDVVIPDPYEFETLPEFAFCPYCGRPIQKSRYTAPPPLSAVAVVVHFLTEPEPAMLWLNEECLGLSPQTVQRVLPGDNIVRAAARGYKAWECRYYFAAGDRKTITIALDKID